jgi:hypothetical protein
MTNKAIERECLNWPFRLIAIPFILLGMAFIWIARMIEGFGNRAEGIAFDYYEVKVTR